MKNFMMNFAHIILAVEVIAMVACFILAGHLKSQELFTLGEFLLLVFIITAALIIGNIENKDE